MAVSIDTVYQRVLALANKEQRGYITPQEFNLLANQAQMMIFEQYFYDLNKFIVGTENDTVHANTVDILKEKIGLFETSSGITLVNNFANLNTLTRFYRLSSIIGSNGVILEGISKKDRRLFNQSPLARPSTSRPVYTVDRVNSSLEVLAYNLPTVTVDYIQLPLPANWGYVITLGEAMYNASISQNFELHTSEETLLVIKILELAGIVLNKQGLAQAAGNEEMEMITQQKLKQ